jgi:hypothetical protein
MKHSLAHPCHCSFVFVDGKMGRQHYCRVETKTTRSSAIWENVRVLLVSIMSLLLLPTKVLEPALLLMAADTKKVTQTTIMKGCVCIDIIVTMFTRKRLRLSPAAHGRRRQRLVVSRASSSMPPTIGGRQCFAVKRSTIVAGHVEQYPTVLIGKVQMLLVR